MEITVFDMKCTIDSKDGDVIITCDAGDYKTIHVCYQSDIPTNQGELIQLLENADEWCFA